MCYEEHTNIHSNQIGEGNSDATEKKRKLDHATPIVYVLYSL